MTIQITMTNTVRNIFIKVPNKFIWIYFATLVLMGSSSLDMFPDKMFWIAWVVLMSMYVYCFYLLYKFYSSKALKHIIINSDMDIVLVYQLPKYMRSHDYITIRQCIKIAVKGNVMKLLENGKYIAKVYRNTLKNKKDWEWIINYFSTK